MIVAYVFVAGFIVAAIVVSVLYAPPDGPWHLSRWPARSLRLWLQDGSGADLCKHHAAYVYEHVIRPKLAMVERTEWTDAGCDFCEGQQPRTPEEAGAEIALALRAAC
jgi:hypothetical protein